MIFLLPDDHQTTPTGALMVMNNLKLKAILMAEARVMDCGLQAARQRHVATLTG